MDGSIARAYLAGITSDQIDRHWPEVEPLLARALARSLDELTPFDVMRACRCGDMQLWAAFVDGRVTAVCVTEVGRDVLLLRALAGEGIGDWRGVGTQLMRDFARSHGCTRLRLIGRPGWKRKLRGDWRLQKVVMDLEV